MVRLYVALKWGALTYFLCSLGSIWTVSRYPQHPHYFLDAPEASSSSSFDHHNIPEEAMAFEQLPRPYHTNQTESFFHEGVTLVQPHHNQKLFHLQQQNPKNQGLSPRELLHSQWRLRHSVARSSVGNTSHTDRRNPPTMNRPTVLPYRIHPQAIFIPKQQLQQQQHTNNVVPKLLVGVLSSSGTNSHRRAIIRQTWANKTSLMSSGSSSSFPFTVQILFLVSGNWEWVSREFEEHRDLVWMGKFPDTYVNIVYKVATLWQVAARHFPDFDVLKVDDDSHVQLDSLLRHVAGKHAYGGKCFQKAPVLRLGEWSVSSWDYPEREYPPYGQGAGYWMSPSLVRCVARLLPVLPVVPVEDAHTGILARACRIPCQHSPRVTDRQAAWVNDTDYYWISHKVYKDPMRRRNVNVDTKRNQAQQIAKYNRAISSRERLAALNQHRPARFPLLW